MRATVDTSGFDRKVAETLRLMTVAEREAMAAKVDAWVRAFVAVAPKDTNRFVNGFVVAALDTGLSTVRPLPVVPSVRRDRFLAVLRAQVESFARRVEKDQKIIDLYRMSDARSPLRADGRPRKRRVDQPYFHKASRRLEENRKRHARAVEELEKAVGSDVFVAFIASHAPQRKEGRGLTTVRDKVYGGTGSVTHTPRGVEVVMRNLEPHARIVEANPRLGHPVSTAHALVNASGKAAVGRAFRDRLRAGPMSA